MKGCSLYFEKGVCLLAACAALCVSASRTRAATNDVTGLTPTLTVSFDGSVANVNGSGSLTVNNEGTPTYPGSPNVKAIDLSLFTPYGNLTSVATASNNYTVSAFATLGTNSRGIMFHLRDDEGGSKGGLVVRRGTNANEVVVTVAASTTPVLTVSNVDFADTLYHHYALVATSNGISLYIDGTQRASTSSTSWAKTKNNYQFGSRHGGIISGEAKYGGKLDDFRVYGAALTPEQIQSINASLTAAAAGLGMISIKTGTRGDLAGEGNVSTFGSLELGPVPVAALTWNKTPNGTAGTSRAVTNLQNSAGVISGMKLYYAAPNTYYGAGPSGVPNGALTKTYLDDGTAATYTIAEGGSSVVLPNPGVTRGWEVMLTNIPYQHADLYLIIASDQAATSCSICPVMIKVGDGAWASYYGMPGIGRTMTGSQGWPGSPYSAGELYAGDNYLKISLSDLTTNTALAIAHGARDTTAGSLRRIGLAGIQLVRRDGPYTADDPYYLRTVTGSVNWDDAVWTHAGTTMNAWSNSTPAWKTTALLSTSGSADMALPAEGVTAEAVSVGGSGAFTLSGPGALALNGDSALDFSGMAATDVVTIAAAVQGSNVTLTANNIAAAGSGYAVLTSGANVFSNLTVRRGALEAASQLPEGSAVALSSASLLFRGSGLFGHPVAVTGENTVRVLPSVEAEIAAALSGSGSITKADAGSLTFSGGGRFGDLLWKSAGTVRLTGSAPYTFGGTSGNGYGTTFEIAAPATLSGALSLGEVTFPVGADSFVAANAWRGCDNGAYTTTVAQTGGRLTVLGNNNTVGTSASVILANTSGGLCSYSLSGGDFLATNAVVMLSWQGRAEWTVSGSGRSWVKGVNMKGSASASGDCSAALTLSGGTLEVGDGGFFASNTSRPRTVTLSTGIVRAWSNFTFAASAVSNAVSLTDAATGVTVDPNGKTITWSAPLDGAGKLVLNDASASPGRLRLLASSTHSGGIEVRGGTLEAGLVNALGTGPLSLYGGRLEVGTADVACGALAVTNTAVLSVRVGIEADFSGSGSLSAPSVELNGSATNTLAVLIDLNGLSTPVAEYPVILSPSIPADALTKMVVAYTNGGAGLPVGASVSLTNRADGIYAVFTGVTSPRNLFWRNGVAAGSWSLDTSDMPWGVQSVGGDSASYTNLDTVNFTDTDQSAVAVTVQDGVAPSAMNVDNADTAYSFASGGGGSPITLPAAGFAKRGSGTATFDVPVAATNGTLTVSGGTLQVIGPLGVVSTATLSAPLVVASNAAISFANSATQTVSGSYSGSGTLRATNGRLKISSSGAAFSGDVVAASGVVEVATASAFLSSSANLRVEAGATMEFTALDASGYNVANTKPIEIAGTLKVLQRDSTARGVKLFNGGSILLKGSGMDSGHALDLFGQPTFALVSGAASISPLDPADASQASIIVRTEHVLKTFDVQASDAVLSVATPLIGGSTANIIDKIGPGTLLWTGTNTTVAKLRASEGTFAIGGAGVLGSGASAQVIEVLAGAVFRYASSASQTLSGAVTCSGSFAKTGGGRLSLTGAVALNAGGELAIPGVAAAADAVKANSLSLNGGSIRVNNAGELRAGVTYTLLTADSALPSGVVAAVTGLDPHWRVYLSEDGKAVQLYKSPGTLLLMR